MMTVSRYATRLVMILIWLAIGLLLFVGVSEGPMPEHWRLFIGGLVFLIWVTMAASLGPVVWYVTEE